MLLRSCLLSLLLFAAGCDSYTKVRPKQADVAGVYRPTTRTDQFLRARKGYAERDTYVTLARDQSCKISNMPDLWLDGFGESRGGFDSYKGTWRLTKHTNGWGVYLRLSWIGGASKGQKDRESILVYDRMMLAGERPPYRLQFIIGDPDSGESLEFEKRAF